MSSPVTYAEVADVEKAVKEWSDEVVQCRTFGHLWQPRTADWNSKYKYWRISQGCPRCKSERWQELNSKGAPLCSWWYIYEEGYLVQLGRIVGEAKDVVRLAAITRTFDVRRNSGKAATEDTPRSSNSRIALGIAV